MTKTLVYEILHSIPHFLELGLKLALLLTGKLNADGFIF